ncbi:MAG: hypothetical protein JW821_17225 [Deltaproteobacteria bacterium]|nr:hypothetical protein [Deltaproteobacteria bacterium]
MRKRAVAIMEVFMGPNAPELRKEYEHPAERCGMLGIEREEAFFRSKARGNGAAGEGREGFPR